VDERYNGLNCYGWEVVASVFEGGIGTVKPVRLLFQRIYAFFGYTCEGTVHLIYFSFLQNDLVAINLGLEDFKKCFQAYKRCDDYKMKSAMLSTVSATFKFLHLYVMATNDFACSVKAFLLSVLAKIIADFACPNKTLKDHSIYLFIKVMYLYWTIIEVNNYTFNYINYISNLSC